MSEKRCTRSGLTIIEVSLSTAILGIVFAGLSIVLAASRRSMTSGSSVMDLEARGNRAMQRIVSALRTTDAVSVAAVPIAPFSAGEVTFQRNLGYQGQQTVWSTPNRLSLAGGSITLTENQGLGNERATQWCSGVTPMLEGEILNGVDDNGNGLIDEPGLCFERAGALVTIRFTLSTSTPDGEALVRTWMTRILCRN